MNISTSIVLQNNLEVFSDCLKPSSAYVHIPFCRRRCFYCDFPISVVGDRKNGSNSHSILEYITQLQREIACSADFGFPLQTVFFGGGTPSLLTVSQVGEILNVLNQKFAIASDAEISMEIDPGTFNFNQVQGYRKAGVNRISLGVQSLQSKLLQKAGRSHSLDEIYQAVDLIHQANFPHFSVDLISGLPEQTLEDWQESLEKAVNFNTNHISIYDLTIEPGTVFGRYFEPGEKPLPTDETTVEMYRMAQRILTTSGFEHYEISNYAKPGHQCRHNRVYWENKSYYGFGLGAASYLAGKRFTRPRKIREYYDWIEQDCPIEVPELAQEDLLLETLMLGLRLADGIKVGELISKFGEVTFQRIWKCLERYYNQGWVLLLEDSEKLEITTNLASAKIRLSDPEGFLFSNVILSDLFKEFSQESDFSS